MTKTTRYKRYARTKIKEALSDTPVVFIMGARQSGKTTLAKTMTTDNWEFVDLDVQTQRDLIRQDPLEFIHSRQDKMLIIDEIQRLPELLLVIKQSVDNHREPGRFLLTGSANALVLPSVVDSLAGRIETILLSPLSECEINDSKPTFLTSILHTKTPIASQTVSKDYLINRVVTGCFPEPLQRQKKHRISAWYKQYIHSLIQKDMEALTHIDQPDNMLKLLKLTAYFSSKLINFSEIGNKINLNKDTTKKYIRLIEHLFLLRQLPAWHSNQSKRLSKTPKLHVCDTGMACAIRDIDETYLMQNPTEQGSLLETFVINELYKQSAWLAQDITFYHYRDKDKVEVDCIMENARGDCFAIEVKASSTLTVKDFKGLNRFKTVAGQRFKIGLLLYTGHKTLPFGENLFAVPISALWFS